MAFSTHTLTGDISTILAGQPFDSCSAHLQPTPGHGWAHDPGVTSHLLSRVPVEVQGDGTFEVEGVLDSSETGLSYVLVVDNIRADGVRLPGTRSGEFTVNASGRFDEMPFVPTPLSEAQQVAAFADAQVAALVPGPSLTGTALDGRYATTGEVRSHVTTSGADQTAALQAELDALYAAGGGTLLLPEGTITLNGILTLANDAATPAKQPAIRIVGAGGAHFSGRGTAIQGGTVLDIKGTDTYGKIKTNGLGLLAIENVTFKDSASTTTPFVYSTNTTLHIDQCAFAGAKAGAACDQDAIVLGGINQVEGGNGWTDGFQGYGTVISRNYFSGIRTCVKGQAFANAVVVVNNIVWTTCGNTTGAPIEWNGAPGAPTTQYAAGCIIRDNLLEVPNYAYAVKLAKCAAFTVAGNGVFDKTATTLAAYRIEANSTGNVVHEGFTAAALTPLSDAGTFNWFYPITQGQYAYPPPSKYLDVNYPTTVRRLIVDGINSLGLLVQPYAANNSDSEKMAEFKRAANDGTNPGASIWYMTQAGAVVMDPTAAQGGNYTGPFARWTGGGRLWSGVGSAAGQSNGARMEIDSGPGGSYLDLKNYATRFYDHNAGPLRALIGGGADQIRFGTNGLTGPGVIFGTGAPEGARTAPVGSLFCRTDGGAGSTLYVKESGTGNTGWAAK